MPSEASTGRALPAPDGAPAAAGAATAVTRVAALKFLDAYWAGDLERALAACVPSAVVELPSSVPMLSPALMSEVLPVIFGSVYPRFVDSRFDIQIERCISQDGVAVVEYVAAGEYGPGPPAAG